MILNETVNIPETFFGISFQDVQVKIENEPMSDSGDFIDGEIANVYLLKSQSVLGGVFDIPLHDVDGLGVERIVLKELNDKF